MNDELCSALEMFNLANRCAKAAEGLMSLHEHPAAEPEEKKTKAKEAKRKAPAVLAAEPEVKRSRGEEHPPGGRPTCVFHGTNNHDTADCQELRLIHDEHFGRRLGRADRGFGP